MRVLLDCVLEAKSLHDWQPVGTDTGPDYIYWCKTCGSIGRGPHGGDVKVEEKVTGVKR